MKTPSKEAAPGGGLYLAEEGEREGESPAGLEALSSGEV